MNRPEGYLYLALAFSLAGTSVISATYVTGKLGTFTITAVSLFFALLVLVPMCGKRLARYVRSLTLRNSLFLALQALFGIFLFRVFLLNGLYHTSAAEAGILTGATPAITALLAVMLLRERLDGIKAAGVCSTVTGVMILQGLFTFGNGLSLEHIGGNILVLGSAASESVFNTLSRVFAVQATEDAPESSPMAQTTIVSAVALILCLGPALFEQPLNRLAQIGPGEWLALLWYGVFVTALAFIFWYAGIMRCGAFTAAAFSGMMPFTSMLLSVTVLGETAGWEQWVGGIFVIAGMILIGTRAADVAAPPLEDTRHPRKEQVRENGFL